MSKWLTDGLICQLTSHNPFTLQPPILFPDIHQRLLNQLRLTQSLTFRAAFSFFYKLQGKRDFSRFGHLILNISLLKHFDYSIQSLLPTHLVPLEDSETHQVFFFLKHVTHKKSLAEF